VSRRAKAGRPVLLWPGKGAQPRREIRPLLLRELHHEPEAGALWRNLLILADNAPLLFSLCRGPLRKALAAQGGIKLIYCDPPFAVGKDFTFPAPGTGEAREGRRGRSLDALQCLAYRDQWSGGLAAFLSMLAPRLALMRELLAPDGSLYLHCDWRTAPYLRVLLDELFGPERFLGDIVWHYTGGGRATRWFSRKHDRILHYAAGKDWQFNPDAVRVPYAPTSGYAKGGITSAAGKHYAPHPDGTPVDDVWDIPMINPLSAERNGYPTQKPEALMERIILASSKPGDVVADFFCGSGAALVCAERLGRRWIGADSSPPAIQAARKRLLEPGRGKRAENPCAPFAFAVLNDEYALEPTERRQSGAPHTAALPGAAMPYALRDIAVRLSPEGEGLGVELQGFVVSGGQAPPVSPGERRAAGTERNIALFEKLLAAPWPDWLDSWSVGLLGDAPQSPSSVAAQATPNAAPQATPSAGAQAPSGAPPYAPPGCRADASCARVLWHSARRGKTPPELRALVSLNRWSEGARLLLTLVDIFANESSLVLDLP
jgi:DNA modification methylase